MSVGKYGNDSHDREKQAKYQVFKQPESHHRMAVSEGVEVMKKGNRTLATRNRDR